MRMIKDVTKKAANWDHHKFNDIGTPHSSRSFYYTQSIPPPRVHSIDSNRLTCFEQMFVHNYVLNIQQCLFAGDTGSSHQWHTTGAPSSCPFIWFKHVALFCAYPWKHFCFYYLKASLCRRHRQHASIAYNRCPIIVFIHLNQTSWIVFSKYWWTVLSRLCDSVSL